MSGVEVNVLTFTTLYPSSARPRYGVFIESRLRRLVQRGGVRASVVAPVPWFPFTGERWGEYGRIARTPAQEERDGINVVYPRYSSLPHIGYGLKPWSMARAGLEAVESLLKRGRSVDLVDGHYLYPDGVAAAEIARRLNKPYVLSARGTDVNVIARMPGPMKQIRRAIEGAAGVITVSAALKASLVGLGVPQERVCVLRNGVDTDLFFPEDRAGARRKLDLPAEIPVVVCVGNLVQEKRPHLALEAAARLGGLHIVFVGRGPQRVRLERLADELRVRDRVRFLAEMSQADLRSVYSAANALVLASEREGWPNVLLEAAACGTPSAAFAVGGVPEIVVDPALGVLASGAQDAGSLAQAIGRVLENPPARDAVRSAAVRFGWQPVLDAQIALYRRAAGLGLPRPAVLEAAHS
jgi:glycosyltransferase involved in cell wall biosynthesis